MDRLGPFSATCSLGIESVGSMHALNPDEKRSIGIYVPSASMAEAMAMQEGLLLAIQKGCNFVEAESDCTEVIHYCFGEDQIWNDAIAIYVDCLEKAGIIGKVEFKFCPCEMNNVAHSIAVYGAMCNQLAICEIPDLVCGEEALPCSCDIYLWLGLLCLHGFVQSRQTNNHVLSMGYLQSFRHNNHQTLHNRKN
jgi:hypothetical protein